MSENFYDKFYKHNKSKAKSKESEKKSKNFRKNTDAFTEKSENRKENSWKNHKNETINNFTAPFSIENSLFKTGKLDKISLSVLNDFDEIVQGVKPLNSRQLQQLPDNIKALSHQLTDQRADRRLGYMNDNVQLSAYVHYYTWWNLLRLTRLFSNLPSNLFPKTDCVCLDLGSGPLTLVIALWLARPELRKLKLTWYCLDLSSNSMALGEDIFLSIVSRTLADSGEETSPWHIIRVKGSFGTSLKQKTDFVCSANMFNELDQASTMPPEYQTKKYFDQLKSYAKPSANFLLIEPGVPKASRTLSLLRTRFIADGKKVLAPCPHQGECPMNGFKAYTGSQNKWCNFAFTTQDAPQKLQKLSENAKLPKERATLSFLAVTSEISCDDKIKNDTNLFCQVASDSFFLPEKKYGHYACSELGLLLLRTKENQTLNSGDLISVKIKNPDSLQKDEKSGAFVIDL